MASGALNAASIASFDLGVGTVQSGFTQLGGDGIGPLSATTSGITLRLVGGGNLAAATAKDASGNFNSTTGLVSRGRTGPAAAFGYSNLYSDFSTANVLGIELLGLTANTAYSINFYSYDHDGSRTHTFTDITNGTGNSGTVTYTTGAGSAYTAATSNEINSTAVLATSDSSGRLFFSGTGIGSSNVGLLSGLVVSVPEPSTSAAFLGGLAILFLQRKRRVQNV